MKIGSDSACRARQNKLHMPSLTYKDNDFRAPLIFHDEEGRRISNQLLKDSIFLKSHNIMDYSLIIGIVKIQQVRKQYDTYKTAIKRVRQNELLKSRQASMSSIKQDNQEQCEVCFVSCVHVLEHQMSWFESCSVWIRWCLLYWHHWHANRIFSIEKAAVLLQVHAENKWPSWCIFDSSRRISKTIWKACYSSSMLFWL